MTSSALAVRHLRLLQAGSLTSTVDRFVVAPLLLAIASGFGVSLTAAAPVAGWYFLLYGTAQPLWGLCSDRLGRVRTMRLALGLAAAAGLVSVVAPTLTLLVVARAGTGAAMAAVVPAGLVYVGDVVPLASRQRTVTDLNAATALGITAATGFGGVLASVASWRLAFLAPALSAAALAVALRALPEPFVAVPAQSRVGLRLVLTSPWAMAVLGLALVEGAALLGLLAFYAPDLESGGLTATMAGIAAASYGLGLLLASRLVKRALLRTAPARLLGAGAGVLAMAHLVAALVRAPLAVTGAALLVGVAWAFVHSTMQTWATEVAPDARAVMVSMFAGSLFVGSGVATMLLAPLAGSGRWALLFAVGAALAAAFGALAPAGRARFDRRRAGTD